MSDFSDENLIQEFLVESQDHLENIEPDLLVLEKMGSGVDPEIVNRIFRAIHSIKGAAGFFGFENLKRLSHVMESVLMRVRDKQLTPEPYVVEPLLKGVDQLGAMVHDINNSETIDCAGLIVELNHYLKEQAKYGGSSVAAPAAEKVIEAETPAKATPKEEVAAIEESKNTSGFDFSDLPFPVKVEAAEKALARGQQLYLIQASNVHDCQEHDKTASQFLGSVASLGVVLGTSLPSGDELEDWNGEAFLILFGTVIEECLLSIGLTVPESAIIAYDPTTAKSPREWDLGGSLDASQESPAVIEAAVDVAQEVVVTATAAPAPPKASPASASPAADGNDSIRVKVELLNRLMDFAGELVLSRNQLIRAAGQAQGQQSDMMSQIVQNIDLVTSNIQEHIMQTRMQPVDTVFRKFPRVVRDLSNQLEKKIQLEMSGQDTELDKSILESLSDPLTHVIRNCCDHGLELPEQRIKAGKNPMGTIHLKAYHEGGQINIVIRDDGKGIDTQRVGRKAIEKGLITSLQFETMSHQEQLNLIFHAGLSTAEQVSDLSGRGVGMDVVRANIEKLGGNIALDSNPGLGTTLTLRLPLTLAIIPSLVVGVCQQRFAIPQINLVELVRVRASEISTKVERVGRASVLRLRGSLLPLVKLAEVLNLDANYVDPVSKAMQPERRQTIEDMRMEGEAERAQTIPVKRQNPASDYNILVLRVGNNQYGLIVDQVFDTEEIVVKSLSSFLKNGKCFSGTTIMGDGKVAMILDAAGISNHAKLNFSEVEAEEQRRLAQLNDTTFDFDDSKKKQAVILFTNNDAERFALPLSNLLRLEKINITEIELVGNREFISYRGKSVPLLRLEHYLPVRPSAMDLEEAFVIVPKHGDGCVCIFAAEILDTVETDVQLDTDLIQENELSGSALLNNHLTLFLDVEALLERAGIHYNQQALATSGQGASHHGY
jgi:two-component system, chemotaxis family, sensor kinase CheA